MSVAPAVQSIPSQGDAISARRRHGPIAARPQRWRGRASGIAGPRPAARIPPARPAAADACANSSRMASSGSQATPAPARAAVSAPSSHGVFIVKDQPLVRALRLDQRRDQPAQKAFGRIAQIWHGLGPAQIVTRAAIRIRRADRQDAVLRQARLRGSGRCPATSAPPDGYSTASRRNCPRSAPRRSPTGCRAPRGSSACPGRPRSDWRPPGKKLIPSVCRDAKLITSSGRATMPRASSRAYCRLGKTSSARLRKASPAGVGAMGKTLRSSRGAPTQYSRLRMRRLKPGYEHCGFPPHAGKVW